MLTVTAADKAVLPHVDHIVYGTQDFDGAVARLEQLLGIRASFGGKHPGGGTQNALIALGSGMYLEIMAPDPDQPDPPRGRPFGLDSLLEPRIVAWLAKTKDIQGLVARARGRGITMGEVRQGSRQRPDGAQLSWQFTDPWITAGDGIVPVFIDWGASPHPSAAAPKGVKLIGLRAEHPQAEKVKSMLDALGVSLRVKTGPNPAINAIIATPDGVVELR